MLSACAINDGTIGDQSVQVSVWYAALTEVTDPEIAFPQCDSSGDVPYEPVCYVYPADYTGAVPPNNNRFVDEPMTRYPAHYGMFSDNVVSVLCGVSIPPVIVCLCMVMM
eukprot:709212_1